MLTSLVAAAWRLSYEVVTNWLARCDDLAEALGYDQFDEQGQRRPYPAPNSILGCTESVSCP